MVGPNPATKREDGDGGELGQDFASGRRHACCWMRSVRAAYLRIPSSSPGVPGVDLVEPRHESRELGRIQRREKAMFS